MIKMQIFLYNMRCTLFELCDSKLFNQIIIRFEHQIHYSPIPINDLSSNGQMLTASFGTLRKAHEGESNELLWLAPHHL